jgi:hypothetical protein
LPSEDQRSAPRRHLILVKGGGPSRRKRREPAASAKSSSQEQELQLIDCRPNLYERLAKVGPLPIGRRLLRAVEDALRLVAAKLRRERRESNDN